MAREAPGADNPLLLAILLTALAAKAPDAGGAASSRGFGPDAGDAGTSVLRSVVGDGGFALDAGERGVVLDATNPDAGLVRGVAVVPKVTVLIKGARVLPVEVYLDTLELPQLDRADAETAKEVQRQLREFLLRTGFELSTVSSKVTPEGIEVQLDEGQIDRIIFLGRLSFQQIRFKLALALPYEVFNRALLDRQVRELAAEMRMPGVRWELVHTAAVAHSGPQVTSLPSEMDLEVLGQQLVHERRPYEVRVVFPEPTGSGLGIDIRSHYVNGLEGGVNFVARDLLGKGDLFFAATSGGVGLRSRIETEKLYPHFSRAYLEARYHTPPILKYFRPNVWVESNLVTRQRADLNLENYFALTLDAATQLEVELRPGLRVAVGGGAQYRRLFGFQLVPGLEAPPDVLVNERARPFLRVTHESVIDPDVLRWDRRHTLESELRYYFPLGPEPGFGWADLRYQFVKELGWHDFWVKSRGRLSWGLVTFHDEFSVAELARGLFGGQFVFSGANLQLEFRFSVSRDEIKIGIFHDLAVFAVPLRTQGTYAVELANAFGPGVHLLVQDMFQLDMYMAFGFRRKAQFNAAFSMVLQKAF